MPGKRLIGHYTRTSLDTIFVYAQKLVRGGIGPASVFFLGFALGPGCIGAALLGKLTDITSINFVYLTCLLRPAVGFLTAFLPILTSSRTPATS